MSEPISAIDGPALIAAVRAGNSEALERAYRMTFGHDMGRLVLAHHLWSCGVGQPLGTNNLKFAAGKIDAALELAAMAGFDASAVAVAVLTDDLEETGHEGSASFDYASLGAEDER